MKLKLALLLVCVALFLSCTKDTEKVIYVSDTMVNCTGVAPQKCFQIKDNEKDAWSNFYGKIEGFDYEEGYNYKLKVDVSIIENPPADGASKKYILLEILEKTKVPVSLAAGSWMVIKIKDTTAFDRNPTITLSMPQGQINGSTSCNKFFGKVNLENNNFKVSSIGATKMMCQDMATETLFLETLNNVAFYKIENDKLQLLASDKTVLMTCSYLRERE